MNQMKFGVAANDITPPVGVPLMGYDPRPSDSIDHRLRAEALACEGENSGWILVGADLCAFSSPLANLVRADIAQHTGLPRDAVMLTATHTHSGPHVSDAIWAERTEQESAYFIDLRRKLTDTAAQAWKQRSPGTLVHARTAAPALASNRRVMTPDGTWTNKWSDPEGTHRGYFDATVDLLGIRRENGSLDALLVNFGCHPVCFGKDSRAISGDYVSYMKDALEESGAAGTVLFTVSGHGNIDPRKCVQSDPQVVREMGEALAGIVQRALPHFSPLKGTGAAAVREPWTFQTTWDIGGRLAIYFPHAEKGAQVETGVTALAAGDIVLLGLPGETVSEYRKKFEKASPFKHTMMISLANDMLGYLPTDEILNQGAYEAGLSPLNPIEKDLTKHVETVLKTVYSAVSSCH